MTANAPMVSSGDRKDQDVALWRTRILAFVMRTARAEHASRISLRELGRQEDLSATFLSRCENGHEAPSERVLRIYADRFEVDFDYLCKLAERVPSDVVQHLVDTPGAIKRVRKEMNNVQ